MSETPKEVTPQAGSGEAGEIKELVSALKDALVDLRTAISEITNPLNIMRRYGEVEELQKIMKSTGKGGSLPSLPTPISASREVAEVPPTAIPQQPPTTKVQVIEPKIKQEERAPEGIEGSSREFMEEHEKEETSKSLEREVSRSHRPIALVGNMPKLIKLIKTIYMLREKLPSDILSKYVDLLSSMGFVPKEEGDVVKKLFEVIDEGMNKGLSIEDQLIVLHILTRSLDIESEELEEEVLKILSSMIRKHGKVGES